MPAFFETFPVILIDQTSTVRADIAFRRSTSTYSMEESQIQVYFSGGCLNGTEYSTPSLVKAYARKAQFGQIALAFSFFFGHLWHASRAIFQDIWTGVNLNHKQNKNMVEMKS